jgi:AAA15 family ATPase/GTPase
VRIEEFRVENRRSTRLAACTALPPLMVIAGPNGTGKSTLLDALRQVLGEGPILYVSPHRTWRRQQVR